MAEREELFDDTRTQTPRLQSNFLTIEDLERGSQWMGGMVGRSPKTLTVFAAIERISRHKTTTIIEGESGTGKELVARALHTYGPTPSGPFVIFNCSNLVDSLAESQLFGHVRGAFTDAREESRGYFRSADGGTLFLDEIGEMPLRLQAKLLRAVETHEVQPVGGTQIYPVDIRLVCATNRDLRAMVRRGEFRNDLFYRLNTCAILIPPLRERPEDVPVLTAHFLRHHSRALDKNVSHISPPAFRKIQEYSWPGNARELSHAIENAVILSVTGAIEVANLNPVVTGEAETATALSSADAPPLQVPHSSPDGVQSLDSAVRDAMLRSLDQTRNNRRRAAKLLGISRSTLYRMLKRYGIASRQSEPGARLNKN